MLPISLFTFIDKKSMHHALLVLKSHAKKSFKPLPNSDVTFVEDYKKDPFSMRSLLVAALLTMMQYKQGFQKDSHVHT